MPPRGEDIVVGDETPDINPYEVLGIEKTATADEVKSAYRKAALKHHPDKAPHHLKSTAHTTFQTIALAYAVLSSPTRRARYDRTGSTSESVSSDNFSWSDFYSSQYADIVSEDAIAAFAATYKGSDEEKDDLLAAYESAKGKMAIVYQTVILSDQAVDEDRFRVWINEAIEKGEVLGYKAYTHESARARSVRFQDANNEAEEAEAYAKELGVADKLWGNSGNGKGKGKGKKADDEAGLQSLIAARQASRAGFFDALEAKWAPEEKEKPKPKKRGRKEKENRVEADPEDDDYPEPDEEAFQATRKKLEEKVARKKKAREEVQDAEAEVEARPKRKRAKH